MLGDTVLAYGPHLTYNSVLSFTYNLSSRCSQTDIEGKMKCPTRQPALTPSPVSLKSIQIQTSREQVRVERPLSSQPECVSPIQLIRSHSHTELSQPNLKGERAKHSSKPRPFRQVVVLFQPSRITQSRIHTVVAVESQKAEPSH